MGDVRRFLRSLDRTSHIMKLIVFSLLLAYGMVVPAPEAEAKLKAEADPAALASYSAVAYGYHYPLYHYGYYGYPYYHILGKRSAAKQQPRFRCVYLKPSAPICQFSY